MNYYQKQKSYRNGLWKGSYLEAICATRKQFTLAEFLFVSGIVMIYVSFFL